MLLKVLYIYTQMLGIECIADDMLSLFSIPVGDDYIPLSMDLTFNGRVKRIDLNVTINDDDIVELNEIFSGRLTVVTMGPNAPQSTLNPATAQISILDEADSELMCKSQQTHNKCQIFVFSLISNHCWTN